MGIRFLCQHCRRPLNVKTAQAGQSGECPACGQSITVPLESKLSEAELNQGMMPTGTGSIFDVDNQITEAGLTSSIRLETDSATNVFSVPEASEQPAFQSLKRSAPSDNTDLFLLDKPQLPSSLGKIDPLEAEPRKVWYYRSRELGEKGPLKAKVMQSELDSGNVTIGCIVWREDWDEWQPAEKVFPSLVALDEANRMLPSDLSPQAALRRRQRQIWILSLVAIVCGLMIVGGLVYYLSRVVTV